jgi:hypothetical protein
VSPKKKPLPTERGKNPNKRSPMGSGRLVEDVLHICLHWRGHIGCQFLRHPGEMPGLFGERLHLFARVFPPNATEIIKHFLLVSHHQVFRSCSQAHGSGILAKTAGGRVPEMPGERAGAKKSEEALEGEVLEPNFRPSSKHPPLDIGSVIADALKKAGLLKSG